ncbi:MAG TPA: hypothetical protein VMW69_00040, partial [Spirochaetia bacterium]|nr:hypothetical protein [Spirochaetia bacterium]
MADPQSIDANARALQMTVGDRQRGRRISAATRAVLYLLLALFACLTLFPFFWMILTSFKLSGDVFKIPPSFIPTKLFTKEPFGNYADLLTKFSFARYLVNSVFVSSAAAFGQLVTCSLA